MGYPILRGIGDRSGRIGISFHCRNKETTMSDSKALFKIAPYNKRSRSAIALAQALDCLRLSTGGSWDSDESRDIQLINWGLVVVLDTVGILISLTQ